MRTSRGVVAVVLAAALAPACGSADQKAERAHDARSSVQTTVPPESTTPTTARVADSSAGSPSTATAVTGRATTTTTRSPSSGPAASPDTHALDVFAPPDGTYRYRVTGTSTSQTGPTRDTQTIDSEETDTVTGSGDNAARRVQVVTTSGDDERTLVYAVDAQSASLTELSFRSADGPVIAVRPQPAVPIARLPYREGDRWEFAWQDLQAGLRGVGAGAVIGREPVGSIPCWVIENKQKLSGSISGTFDTTVWVDPATGRQLRQHVVTQLDQAGRRDTTDVVRTLV